MVEISGKSQSTRPGKHTKNIKKLWKDPPFSIAMLVITRGFSMDDNWG
jgi:hypothetical protein